MHKLKLTLKRRNADRVDQVVADSSAEDEFGRRLTLWLSEDELGISGEYAERLRAARARALASRKVAPRRPPSNDKFLPAPWNRLGARGLQIASAVPVVALLFGLWIIDRVQSDRLVSERAEVDLKLLTDKLPLSAFTDPGFAEFIKRGRTQSGEDEA